MTNIIAQFKRTHRKKYAPKKMFWEARAVLAAYVRTAHPADRMDLLKRGKITEQELDDLIRKEPEGMVYFSQLERIIRLIEVYETILTWDHK